MRKIGALAMLAMFAAGAIGAGAASARDLRVMTFNVRFPNPDDGANV